MSKKIVLNFIPKDFKGDFVRDCAIYRAVKRQLGRKNSSVTTTTVVTDHEIYTISKPRLNGKLFKKDLNGEDLRSNGHAFGCQHYDTIADSIKNKKFQSASVELILQK